MLFGDLSLLHALAIAFLFVCWFTYAAIMHLVAQGSLNEQLGSVRAQWLTTSITRGQKPFDAILLGNMVNSIAFFGSATMIVLAGVITLFASAASVHEMVQSMSFVPDQSFELFALNLGILNVILAIAFFSFTYGLRKLIYVLALVGAFPEGELDPALEPHRETMVKDASAVLTEALKTFNFGIRGYYYFVSALGLFISPWLCIGLTVAMTAMLVYRQVWTTTATSINSYVAAQTALQAAQKTPPD